jgi:predicted anti-sigma-YlaC factor YlaD
MRLVKPPSTTCDRARGWVSLELDGELSELERALLRAHTARCAACREFRHDVRRATRELRMTPLVQPELVFAPPRRRLVSLRAVQVSAAAAAAVVAVGIGTVYGTLRPSTGTTTSKITFVDLTDQKLRALSKNYPRPLDRKGRAIAL